MGGSMNESTPVATKTSTANEEVNIDLECMNAAEGIINTIKNKKLDNPEKAINEAIAVLKENGLYSLVIYLEANKNNEYSLIHETIEKVGDRLLPWIGQNLREKVKKLAATDNIFTLFFAVDIIEQMLVYARYLAKGLPKKPNDHIINDHVTEGTDQS
jgi:hypothetical protein